MIVSQPSLWPARLHQARMGETVGSYLFLPESTGSFDCVVCLGCTSFAKSAHQGISLYKQSRCRKLLLTGGHNPKLGGNEALLMAGLALREGIPETDLLIESTSTNTLENFLHTKTLLQQLSEQTASAFQRRPRIALVSIHYHSRRAYETFRHVFGEQHKPAVIPYASSHYTSANWWKSWKGYHDVLGELRRIEAYLPHAHRPEMVRLLLRHNPEQLRP